MRRCKSRLPQTRRRKRRWQEVEARLRDMELEIAAAVEKRQTAEQRLYSGEVQNPKELQDMQMEVEALARRKSVLDDELRQDHVRAGMSIAKRPMPR